MAKTLWRKLLSNDQWMSTQSTSFIVFSTWQVADMIGGKGIKASLTVKWREAPLLRRQNAANMGVGIKKGTNFYQYKKCRLNILLREYH